MVLFGFCNKYCWNLMHFDLIPLLLRNKVFTPMCCMEFSDSYLVFRDFIRIIFHHKSECFQVASAVESKNPLRFTRQRDRYRHLACSYVVEEFDLFQGVLSSNIANCDQSITVVFSAILGVTLKCFYETLDLFTTDNLRFKIKTL